MEYFLQLFGDKSIGWAVAIIAAAVFLYGCYKKIASYFSDKAVREAEKDREFKDVMSQVKKNQEWHQQSIDVRDQFNVSIKEIVNKLDAVNRDLQDMKKVMSQDKATTCRYRILRFADEISHGTKHSREHFDQILDDITTYERYCDKHPEYENNKAVLAISNIKRIYQNCVTEGTFL